MQELSKIKKNFSLWRLADIVLPTLLAFGALFMVLGVKTTVEEHYIYPLCGAVALGWGLMLILGKISRLEKKVVELQKMNEQYQLERRSNPDL